MCQFVIFRPFVNRELVGNDAIGNRCSWPCPVSIKYWHQVMASQSDVNAEFPDFKTIAVELNCFGSKAIS
jgi:hypothetical protein